MVHHADHLAEARLVSSLRVQSETATHQISAPLTQLHYELQIQIEYRVHTTGGCPGNEHGGDIKAGSAGN